jgi:hypothetical protein
MMLQLNDQHAEYIRGLWADLREANRQVRRFDKEWNEINDAINAKHDADNVRRRERGEYPLTDLMMAEAKNASLPLQDAYAAGSWWRAKAVWLAEAIQAEKAAMEMLNGNANGWLAPRIQKVSSWLRSA